MNWTFEKRNRVQNFYSIGGQGKYNHQAIRMARLNSTLKLVDSNKTTRTLLIITDHWDSDSKLPLTDKEQLGCNQVVTWVHPAV
jgi:hypothetical protein